MMDRNQNAEVTLPGLTDMTPQRLVLNWGAHEEEVNGKRRSLTVGREDTNGIVIKSDKVSRVHVRIEYRNGHFALTDKSSNGTYVADSAGRTHKVNNETYVLMGAGTISFGINPETEKPLFIRYAVKS